MRRLQAGDFVRVRRLGWGDEWCEGLVAIASQGGGEHSSVGLLLAGVVRTGHDGGPYNYITGALPLHVNYREHGPDITGLDGTNYEVVVTEPVEE